MLVPYGRTVESIVGDDGKQGATLGPMFPIGLLTTCARCGTVRSLAELKSRGLTDLPAQPGDDRRTKRYRVWRKCDQCPSREVKVRVSLGGR